MKGKLALPPPLEEPEVVLLPGVRPVEVVVVALLSRMRMLLESCPVFGMCTAPLEPPPLKLFAFIPDDSVAETPVGATEPPSPSMIWFSSRPNLATK